MNNYWQNYQSSQKYIQENTQKINEIVKAPLNKNQMIRRQKCIQLQNKINLIKQSKLQSNNSNSGKSSIDTFMKFKNLRGDDFRHPLDKSNTDILKSIPGLDILVRSLFGPIVEQTLLLDNIATSVKVGPTQLATIYNLLVEAGQILDMEIPELYVKQNASPNAYTLAIYGRKPFIVLHTAILDLMTPKEIQIVIAHELGHLKCDHGIWLTVANILAGGTINILPVVQEYVVDQFFRWQRASELTCDRASLLVAQDHRLVISVLMKLAGGCSSYAQELSVNSFLEQARSYEEVTSTFLGSTLKNAQTRTLSHPLPVIRAKEIDEWIKGQQYIKLINKYKQNNNVLFEHSTNNRFNSQKSTSISNKNNGQYGTQSAKQAAVF